MVIRNDFNQYGRTATRESRIQKHPKDFDQIGPGLAMTDTLIELASTIVGFLGVMFLIFACVKALGQS